MFLALQARSSSAIRYGIPSTYVLIYQHPMKSVFISIFLFSTRESSVSALKNCWDILKCEPDISFVTLVTGAFPSARDQVSPCRIHDSMYA